ncbi:MAG: deoxyribonuclease IV [Lachnospiraceae bacterium]|nr:deoxyribonuclease IV [Lachnospiraceae bacterium]MDD3614602.1 deoxyribonuclease IV [Lachnospiraceae bacterium]
MLHIGCHLSSSKGFLAMGKTASSIQADTFAFFTRNPRGGKAKALNLPDIQALSAYLSNHQFTALVAHAPYTLNPCSKDPSLREFARNIFQEDLDRLEYLPGQYYNFHPGSHVGQGTDTGIKYIAQMLNQVLRKDQNTTVLLETMSGKGSEIGRNFEELRRIYDLVEQKDKLGICMDTCHIWDGGYDIVNHLDLVLDEFDQILGLNLLKAIHLNDSLNPCDSHKDRHAKIGAGQIGVKALSAITCHPSLRKLPFILETPNELSGYAEEILLMRKLQSN